MDNRELRRVLSGRHYDPDFTIIPQFLDIVSTEDQVRCAQANAIIGIVCRQAEAWLIWLMARRMPPTFSYLTDCDPGDENDYGRRG